MKPVIIVLHCLILSGTAFMVFAAIRYMAGRRLIKSSLITIYEKLNSAGEKRRLSEKQIMQMYGTANKKGLINHMDENLRYSGIQTKHPILTTELYLVISVIVITMSIVLVFLIGGSLIYGALAACVTVLAMELYFNSCRQRRYEQVEEELVPFINSIDAYAGATDDIMSILEKSIPVITGPLKDAVFFAVTQSKSSGNSPEVLRQLEDSIEHPFFKKLVRNLELSSRHSANYKDIITECRSQLDEATRNARMLEEIYRNGRHDIIVLIICGVLCVVMALIGILDYDVIPFFVSMWGTPAGRSILVMCAAALMAAYYIAFIASQKRGHE